MGHVRRQLVIAQMQRPQRALLVLKQGRHQLHASFVLELVVRQPELLEASDLFDERGKGLSGLRIDVVLVEVELLQL